MKLLTLIIWLPLSVRAILFWIQLWQQKEYRLDRMKLYLGDKQNLRFWLGYNIVFNQGLRRPFFTIKAILLLVVSFISVTAFSVFLGLLTSYLAIPVVVSFWVLAITLPSFATKQLVVQAAKTKIRLRKSPLTVIGITGSYGKTSTKLLLEHILKTKFNVFATRQSHNTLFSVSWDILKFLSNSRTHAIIEYGAYKRGEIKQMTKLIRPQIAIITGITKQHYGLFGSYENLKKTKFELLASLPPGGMAFINCEDKNTKEIQQMASQSHTRWRCFETQKWKTGGFRTIGGYLSFYIQTAEKKFIIKTKLLGDTYIENIKAVLAMAEYLGVSAEMTAEALESFTPSDHFITRSAGLNQSTLVNDSGTANPRGFESAMQVVKTIRYPKKVLVTSGIIDLGNVSDQTHAKLGEAAGKVFDAAFYAGTEGFNSFFAGWNKVSGGKPIFRIAENTALVNFQKEINKKTLVLIEGRIPVRILKLLTST